MNATTDIGLPRLAYSIDETGKVLGISNVSVYRLIKLGKLKPSSALRHKLIPISEIERFLDESTQPGSRLGFKKLRTDNADLKRCLSTTLEWLEVLLGPNAKIGGEYYTRIRSMKALVENK